LSSSKTGIYLKNKFISASDKGIITIPEEIGSYNGDVIAVHNGFAVNQNIYIKDF